MRLDEKEIIFTQTNKMLIEKEKKKRKMKNEKLRKILISCERLVSFRKSRCVTRLT